MPSIEIRPATAQLWDDVRHAMTGGGDGASCWCQFFMLSRREFDAVSRDSKRDLLQSQIENLTPAVGLIGYLDGTAAGWVRLSPRPQQPGLLRTRVLRAGSPWPAQDRGVWAISCLIVRREHRGRGMAHELVRAAVRFAGDNGAQVIEAYPRDTTVRPADPNSLYVGTVSLFDRHGFTVLARPTPIRAVMSRTLQPPVTDADRTGAR